MQFMWQRPAGNSRKSRLTNTGSCKYVKSKQDGREDSDEQPNFKDEIENEESEDSNMYYIHKISSREPYTIDLEVNHKMVLFEIDTGSGLTIISENTYEKLFYCNSLQPCRMNVKSYTGKKCRYLECYK